jgi:2-dehydropantoate 2-reductase
VLIVGCGGIGGVVATTLAAGQNPQYRSLDVLTTNARINEVLRRDGLKLQDGRRSLQAKVSVVSELERHTEPYDFVILATQPPQVESAAQQALAWLAPHGALVCLQNGLCEERLARLAGTQRVIGAVVGWGASMIEPGVYERTSRGGFTIGRLRDRQEGTVVEADPMLRALALLLAPVGNVKLTDNLQGVRWSKLAINAGISTIGTLAGERLGPLSLKVFVRRLCLEIMTEAVAVARAEGVKLERVAGTIDLPSLALTERDRHANPSLALKHAVLLVVGAKFRKMRSSMLSAIERGREPAVDFLNGEIAMRAKKHGISTPFNDLAVTAVHELARKEATPSMHTLERFASQLGIKP